MIVRCRDRKTESFARGDFVKAYRGFAEEAGRRLAVLIAATSVSDLRALRGNRLEALSGNRRGQYGIGINMQWRICFEWPRGAPGPVNVETPGDDHQGRDKFDVAAGRSSGCGLEGRPFRTGCYTNSVGAPD